MDTQIVEQSQTVLEPIDTRVPRDVQLRNHHIDPKVYKEVLRRRRKEQAWDCCKKFTSFLFSHIGLCGLVVVYTIMGGFLFEALESPHEIKEKHKMTQSRNTSLEEIWNLALQLREKKNIEYIEDEKRIFVSNLSVIIRDFQVLVYTAAKEGGWDGNDDKRVLQWSYAGALLYSITVITTIGYGHIAPKTKAGRLITLIYALVGIPLTFLYLSNIGRFLSHCFKIFYKKICCGVFCLLCKGRCLGRGKHKEHNGIPNIKYIPEEQKVIEVYEEEEGDDNIRVPVSVCLILMTGYIIGGAWLFSHWEDWDFLTGSYFCFITLTTIGFGDIVPGTETDSWAVKEKLVLCAMYLILGLSLLAMCFNLMQEEVKEKCKWLGMKIGLFPDPDKESQV
ncbi:unnamed protein product [Owenia fusiformis]|uniref:Potassium channel domain-containing protein n=1 Tax=Owenia fusiformis TaxID=6347 RepID=A0A8J1YC95_OWEFU|nr:unnamed protein product [Owenia fusiformis]